MKRKHVSMGTVLRMLLAGSLLFIILFSGVTQIIANQVLIRQTVSVNQNLLSAYANDMDSLVSDMEKYVFQVLSSNGDLERIQSSADEYEILSAKQNVSSLFQQFLAVYPIVSGITLIQSGRDDTQYISNSYQVNNYSSVLEVNTHAKELIWKDSYEKSDWFSVDIQNFDRLVMRIIPFGNFYCCIWITMASINSYLAEYDLGGEGVALLCGEDGSVLNNTGFSAPISFDKTHQDQYIQINQPMNAGAFRIVALLPERSVTGVLQSIRTILFLLVLLLLLVFPITFYVVRRAVYNPLASLIEAMGDAAKGNLNSHIDTSVRLTEFQEVNSYYNRMIDDIRDVKIQAYENKLQEQRVKRYFLQSQIKSHFYLNCINIIYMLAQNKDYQSIEMLSMCLAKYFRYISANADGLVPLGKEIAHIENYIDIQKFRYPGKIRCRISVSDKAADRTIPALMLQTFVENSVKYGQRKDAVVKIEIQVTSGGEGCRILIRDNGNGFPEETLKALNGDDKDISLKGLEGIGIKNVKSRLDLIYQGQADIAFSNDGGAAVRILIPCDKEDGS